MWRHIKGYQHRRFSQTYADMLAHPRFGDAARFFLDDLYGPGDFSLRDEQFAKVVPALVRLFPRDIVQTVLSLGRLHCAVGRAGYRHGFLPAGEGRRDRRNPCRRACATPSAGARPAARP